MASPICATNGRCHAKEDSKLAGREKQEHSRPGDTHSTALYTAMENCGLFIVSGKTNVVVKSYM